MSKLVNLGTFVSSVNAEGYLVFHLYTLNVETGQLIISGVIDVDTTDVEELKTQLQENEDNILAEVQRIKDASAALLKYV